jgi:hypothetical protein
MRSSRPSFETRSCGALLRMRLVRSAVTLMVKSAHLAHVSNHEELAAILRDAAKRPLLRMRLVRSAITLMVRSRALARRLEP